MGSIVRSRGVRVVAALVLIVLAQLGLVAAAGAQGGAAGADGIVDVDPGPHARGEAKHPLLVRSYGRRSDGQPQVATAQPVAYAPDLIQAYLGLSGDGSGQTIAIVDAFDNPNVEDDLNHFSQQFDLPQTCGSAAANPNDCFHFTKATPQGQPRVNRGWALEIALDVQWAHAVAPKAGILLVEANNSTEDNLFGAIDYAAGQGASVISNSWGGDEFAGEEALDSHCVLSHAICVFSSGDSGNPGGYPAYNPAVLAVGGTTLHLAQNGSVTSETAWAGSGGGVSAIEPRPAYQTAVNLQPHRGMPDVSYDADPFTGFPVYDSVGYLFQKGWFGVGGTSAGAPQWSAIVAVADQLRVANGQGRLNSTAFASGAVFYGLAAGLGDITAGSNGNCGEICQAAKGYDLVTGLGSPRAGIDQALAGTLLAAPTGVAASATGANSAQVSWNYSGSTQTAFEVFLSGSDTPAATVGAGSRAAAISGLQPGTRYCFQVVAYDGAVASARSQAACAVTLGSRPVPAGGGINLSPASVTFTNRVETLSVHVAGAGAAPVDGATVYYTTSGGPTCSPANGSGTTDQAGNVSFSCTISSGRFSRLVFSAYAEQNGQAGLQTGPGGDLLIGTQSVFVVF